jgi:hypothetical protein
MGAPGQAKTGGRKAGTPNRKTAALKQAVVEAVGALPDAFEGDGYALLATVYKDRSLPLSVRMTAASTVLAFERPRLSNVDVTTRSLDSLSDEEFFRAWDGLDAFLAQHGRPLLLETSESSADALFSCSASPSYGRPSSFPEPSRLPAAYPTGDVKAKPLRTLNKSAIAYNSIQNSPQPRASSHGRLFYLFHLFLDEPLTKHRIPPDRVAATTE